MYFSQNSCKKISIILDETEKMHRFQNKICASPVSLPTGYLYQFRYQYPYFCGCLYPFFLNHNMFSFAYVTVKDTTQITASKLANTVVIIINDCFNIYFAPLMAKIIFSMEFVFGNYSNYQNLVVDIYSITPQISQ